MKHFTIALGAVLSLSFASNAQTIFTIDQNPLLTSSGTVDPLSFSWAIAVPQHAPPQHGVASVALGVPDFSLQFRERATDEENKETREWTAEGGISAPRRVVSALPEPDPGRPQNKLNAGDRDVVSTV